MTGKYHIIIQNNRIKFEFDIKRNITIIKGDSATGKTTLMNLIETYERQGDESGISLSSKRTCKTLNNSNWENVIEQSKECIIFIDEETNVIKKQIFAEKIRHSDNYYVIITRENLPNLPYSVEEIYGIHCSGKYADVRQTYNSFYQLYNVPFPETPGSADVVIVEDSNSGYDFFCDVVEKNIECVSAGGKSGIKRIAMDYHNTPLLVIADGAAFGSEMGELSLYMQSHPEVYAYLPESFEWLVLSSGLIDGNRVRDILANPEDYADSSEYFSWEQFFTSLLIDETKDTYLHYSKSRLNKTYLNMKEKEAILKVAQVIKPVLWGGVT